MLVCFGMHAVPTLSNSLSLSLSFSAPLLHFLDEHGQICLELRLACVSVVLGLLRMWGAVVFGMGEL